MSHSCAVVHELTDTRPAFLPAASCALVDGLPPGETDPFELVPNAPGRYRLSCMATEHPETGMWDTLVVMLRRASTIRIKTTARGG